jgi:hypothetical protein
MKPSKDYLEFDGEEVILGVLGSAEEQTTLTVETLRLMMDDLRSTIEDFGEWKELVGYLKGKNLNPKLVRKYIEVILEINKKAEE